MKGDSGATGQKGEKGKQVGRKWQQFFTWYSVKKDNVHYLLCLFLF